MESHPIRIQLRKILQENLVEKSCGKFLRENLAGKSCRKFLRENLVGNSCGTRRRGKSQFKKGSDWWKFSIWNSVMGSQPIRIQLGKILQKNLVGNSCGKFLRENLAGKSCRKILQENLAGNSCWNILQEILLEMLWKIPHTNSKLFLKVIFKIYNSSRSTIFSIVNLKNSFLEPILNRFNLLYKIKMIWKVFLTVRGLKMAKNTNVSNFWHVFCHF